MSSLYTNVLSILNSKLFFRCDLIQKKLWNQIELEDALNWLSTLGGAYSNLGDHSNKFVSSEIVSVFLYKTFF